MAIGMINDSTLYDIGDAIREKNGTSTEYLPSEMPEAIRSIETGVELPALDNQANAADMVLGKSLYDSDGNLVTGNVIEIAEGSLLTGINLSELYFINNRIRVTGIADINSRYDGALLRNGSQPRIFVLAEEFGDAAASDVAKGKTFTSANGLLVEGTHECDNGVTLPTLNNPGDENDLLEGVQLIGQDGTIVDGTIPKKTSGDITVDGAMMTVPAGYYENESLHSVSMTTLASPSISVDDTGKITASVTQSAGYVSASTKTATKQLSVQAEQTITPGTSDQTIESGKYLTGVQTIKGDANLLAENIKNGVSIFGVAGALVASSGGSSGLVRKSGTVTDETTIDTGLSEIVFFLLYKNGMSSTGLNLALKDVTDADDYAVYCSSYSTYMKTYSFSTGEQMTFDGGTVTYAGSSNLAMVSSSTYIWVAFGYE